MIDGFKVMMNKYEESALSWIGRYYEDTGEIIPGKKSVAHPGLVFYEKNGFAYCKGSLHKFFNQGHNCGDFRFVDVCESVDMLADLLKTEPKYLSLRNLEFGVTNNMSQPVYEYLNSMLFHGTKRFRNAPCDKIPGEIEHFCEHQRYRLKSYDKRKQYAEQGNWLRTETKATRMEFFVQNGIQLRTLEDLKNPTTFLKLGDLLHKNFSKVIMIDGYNPDNFSRDELNTLSRFCLHPAYDKMVPSREPLLTLEQDRQYKKDRKHYYSELNQLKNIIQKYDLNNRKEELLTAIKNKVDFLL